MSVIGVRLSTKASDRNRCKKLVLYIHDPIGNPDPDKIAKTGGERVLYRGSNAVMSDTPIGIAEEMRQSADIAQARDSRVSDDPFEHFIFSFESHDKVGEQEIRRCIQIAVEHLDVRFHQYTWGAHRDTDNTHIHFMVSRINPISFNALDIKFPVLQAEQIGALINHELGMKPMIKNRYRVNEQTKQVERIKSVAVPKPERLADIINTSKSWAEFHERTYKAGILYEKKGSGALINGDKASNVDRNATMIKLTKIWGEFEVSPYILAPKISQEVVERQQRHERKAERKDERSQLLVEQKEERHRIARGAKNFKQGVLSDQALSVEGREAKLKMIAEAQSIKLVEIRAQQKIDRQKLTQHLNTTLPLIDFRKSELMISGSTSSLPCIDIGNFIAYRVGAEVEYRHEGSDVVSFVDKGSRIVVRDISDESVLAVLELGAAKWGKDLSVIGNDEFKLQVIRLAVAHGIYIANPDLQDQIEQERGRLERELIDLGINVVTDNPYSAPH
ncbi:MAG: LPD7 domain-containing protein [Gallionellaceae bacterium]|nr:LPD7 domain-containing protein [Gallionellaceae bacterium]